MKIDRELSKILNKIKDHFSPKSNQAVMAALHQAISHIRFHQNPRRQLKTISSRQGSVGHLLRRLLVDIIDPLIINLQPYVIRGIIKYITSNPTSC